MFPAPPATASSLRPTSSRHLLRRALFLSVHQSAGFVRRIGDGAYVRYQCDYVAFGKSVSPGRHLCRLVQRRTAVADDGDQVRVTRLVERVAFGEGMWLHRKVVHV